MNVARRTSLRTKLYEGLADQLTDIVVDAVLTIRKPDEPVDLFMVRAACLPAQTGGTVPITGNARSKGNGRSACF